jgi:hypothetical protein
LSVSAEAVLDASVSTRARDINMSLAFKGLVIMFG